MNIKKSENPQGYEEFSKVFEEKMFESFGGIAEKAIDEFMSETSKSPEILEEIQKYLTKTVIGNWWSIDLNFEIIKLVSDKMRHILKAFD